MLLSILFLCSLLPALCTSQQTNVCGGAPGIPGHNGLPGRDGIKGERGEPGISYGIKGDVGDSIKGDKGDSINGIKGEKGDTGDPTTPQKSAFTVLKTSDQTASSDNEVITFQNVITNINSDFDIETNKFTCQIPGTYMFMFAMAIFRPNDPVIHLIKNDEVIVTAHSRTHTSSIDFDQATNAAILNLNVGDQVWLVIGSSGSTVHGHHVHKYDTFSGYLVFEN